LEIKKFEHNPLTHLILQLIFLLHIKLCDSLLMAVCLLEGLLCGYQILWSSCERLGLFIFVWGFIALSILSKWTMVQVLYRGVWRKRNFWELFQGTLSLICCVVVVKEIKSLLEVMASALWKPSWCERFLW